MDVVPFLRSKVCASKEELLDARGRDEGAKECRQWVLALRDDWRSRRSFRDCIQQRTHNTVFHYLYAKIYTIVA